MPTILGVNEVRRRPNSIYRVHALNTTCFFKKARAENEKSENCLNSTDLYSKSKNNTNLLKIIGQT